MSIVASSMYTFSSLAWHNPGLSLMIRLTFHVFAVVSDRGPCVPSPLFGKFNLAKSRKPAMLKDASWPTPPDS